MESTMEPAQSYSWYVNLSDTFNNLPAILQEQGFFHEKKTLMVARLNIIQSDDVYDIHKIAQAREIASWIQVFTQCFETNLAVIESYSNHLHQNAQNSNYGEYYGLYQDQKMVTIGTLFPYKDFSFISNIATLPDYRRKGYASYMIQALLQRSQNLGLRYAVLTTSDAQDLYEKLGFERVFDGNRNRSGNSLKNLD